MMRPEQQGRARPYHAAMTHSTRIVRTGMALAVLAGLGWLGGCLENPVDPPETVLDGLIVSDAILTAGAVQAAPSGLARASDVGNDVAFVSLPPGTVPVGRIAAIRRVGDGTSIINSIVDGGFDPVPVAAGAGDSIDVVVTDATGATVLERRVVVTTRRPPVVVRTEPPRKKTDVPLNSAIILVFSEPIAGASLTSSSVRLFHGTTAVAGTVRLLEGTGSVAAFMPGGPLAANTDYRLEVTRAVQDLDGDALPARISVEFTTGASSTGPPASIMLSPHGVFMTVNTYQMTATVRDAAGNGLIDQPVTWITNDPNGLTVSATGLLTAQAVGSYRVTASVGSVEGFADVIVSAGPPASVWVSVSANRGFTCGVTTARAAYCWGYNASGQLGNGTSYALDPCPAGYCSTVPMAVAGGIRFTSVTGWEQHACGLSTTGAAYCWGQDAWGELGTGGAAASYPPPVTGGLTFSSLSAGEHFSCGVTGSGAAYCWGWNGFGQLGTGYPIDESRWSNPQPVAGGLTFTMVDGALNNTCGLTTSGAAYCWGDNAAGQLGIGSTDGPERCSPLGNACSTVPVAVSGGLTFSSLSVGFLHACGLTPAGAAYCWGANWVGQLGDGSTNSSSVPVPVTGGLGFSSMSVGGRACGVTTAGAAYCWGGGSAVPVEVPGGLIFSTVRVGVEHICGVTTSQVAYCWGENAWGQLGTGTFTNSDVPVKVAGQP
jgi:alpha-tubulin suppressor-like RCC1 family protein